MLCNKCFDMQDTPLTLFSHSLLLSFQEIHDSYKLVVDWDQAEQIFRVIKRPSAILMIQINMSNVINNKKASDERKEWDEGKEVQWCDIAEDVVTGKVHVLHTQGSVAYANMTDIMEEHKDSKGVLDVSLLL